MTQIDELFSQIAKFVLNDSDLTFSTRAQTVVKQHTEKLSGGDIGFPTTIQPWLNAIANPGDALKNVKQIIDDNEDDFARKLVDISADWVFPIQAVRFKQFRCLLFLDRQKCYDGILRTVLYDDASYGQWHDANDADTIYTVRLAKSSGDNSLVEHRCTLIARVLANLLRFSGFKTQPNGHASEFNARNLMEILVTCARRNGAKKANRQNDMEMNNNASGNAKSTLIVCGSVTGRSGLTANDYIQCRSLEMEKLAELKHGYNKENNAILDKCQKLGMAIVTFDLLKIKHFNAIDFEKVMTVTSTVKGAAFILYNVARLQTLLASFDHQVSSGFYAPLPHIDDVDFGLLKEEEEWQMFFVYIVGFPSMLERCISGVDNGQIAIHLLCTFLSNLSSVFSVYYHRVKILTENLPQLVPVMYARVYLLKALRTIFLKSLAILEIEPLDQM